MRKISNGSKLHTTISRATNGQIVLEVVFRQMAQPGLLDGSKIQIEVRACELHCNAQFPQIPDIFVGLCSIIVPGDNDLIQIAQQTNPPIFCLVFLVLLGCAQSG